MIYLVNIVIFVNAICIFTLFYPKWDQILLSLQRINLFLKCVIEHTKRRLIEKMLENNLLSKEIDPVNLVTYSTESCGRFASTIGLSLTHFTSKHSCCCFITYVRKSTIGYGQILMACKDSHWNNVWTRFDFPIVSCHLISNLANVHLENARSKINLL